jgi:hypothetical protein
MPLSIEVQGLDRTYQFGGRVPLKFTIRNEASHSIWLNVSMLPWNYRYSLSVSEDSPYLASGPTIHDIWDIRWRELKPEEAISGEYDLSQRLAIRERPPSREAVIARIAVSVFVTESDPEVSERRVLDIDLGQLTIEVSPTRSPR